MSDWKDVEGNKTWLAMQRVRELAEKVVTGKKSLQMFCSPPGFGKTDTVLEVLARHGRDPHYCSPDKVQGFCQELWTHRNTTYFIDDCNTLAKDERLANIGKMAWGPQQLVIVPYNLRIDRNEQRRLAGDPSYDPNTPPPQFPMGRNHGLIWNENDNYTDPGIRKQLANGFAALDSRGLDPVWIPDDPQDVLNYTIWMIVNGMLRRHRQKARPGEGGFSLGHQQQVLDFFCTHGRRLKELTPRMAWLLAYDRRHDPNYEKAWADRLLPDVRWPGLILPETTPQLMSPSMRKATLILPGTSDEPAKQHEVAPTTLPATKAAPAEPPTAPVPDYASVVVRPQLRLIQGGYKAANNNRKSVAPLNRDAIIQDIARTFYGRLRWVTVLGTASAIEVHAHDEPKTLICRCDLAPHPEVADEFAIEILSREKGGRFLVKELTVKAADRKHVTVKAIEWVTIVGADAKDDLLAECKIAKAGEKETVTLDVVDGKLRFAPSDFRFARRDLEWLLRKKPTTLRFSKRGVLAATVPGIAGEYEFFLRGWGY
jgi:hypothetical protein